jgi:hypothetical protein
MVLGGLLAASLCFAPAALARTHVSVGVALPGVSIGVGNCWNCGYAPVYPAPVYYPSPVYYAPAPVYYAPAPVYYGYGYGGYYAPRRAYRYHRGYPHYYGHGHGDRRGGGHNHHR